MKDNISVIVITDISEESQLGSTGNALLYRIDNEEIIFNKWFDVGVQSAYVFYANDDEFADILISKGYDNLNEFVLYFQDTKGKLQFKSTKELRDINLSISNLGKCADILIKQDLPENPSEKINYFKFNCKSNKFELTIKK